MFRDVDLLYKIMNDDVLSFIKVRGYGDFDEKIVRFFSHYFFLIALWYVLDILNMTLYCRCELSLPPAS